MKNVISHLSTVAKLISVFFVFFKYVVILRKYNEGFSWVALAGIKCLQIIFMNYQCIQG